MQWQLHEAKHGFGRLVHRALAEGPQVVTRHGEALVVVLSAREYTRLTGEAPEDRPPGGTPDEPGLEPPSPGHEGGRPHPTEG